MAAATDWDGEMEVKTIRPSHADSVERCLHLSGRPRFLLGLTRHQKAAAAMRQERFIGVIYRP